MMKRLIAMPLMFALCGATVFAQSPAAENELKQIEKTWSDAQKSKNVEKLRLILADNWVGIGWDGAKSDKAQALADLQSPSNSLESTEAGPMTVRIFGNTAVVTGTNTEKSMEHGKDSSGKYIWTDVFVKQEGRWRAVASQSAKFAE